MQEINIEGWTTAPVEHEFTPSYVRADGKVIAQKYTLHLLVPRNGNGNGHGNGNGSKNGNGHAKIRVNIWGPQADRAKSLFMDASNRALLKIVDGVTEDYTCRYTGRTRFSVNVNIREQVKIIKREPWVDDGFGFEGVLNKLQRQHEDQRDFGEPFI